MSYSESGGRGQRLLTVLEYVYVVVFAFQALPHESGQGFIIFGDKNSHKVNRP
jgi:hypothetical protein